MSISRLLAEGDKSIIYTSGHGVKMRPGMIIFTLPSSTPGLAATLSPRPEGEPVPTPAVSLEVHLEEGPVAV